MKSYISRALRLAKEKSYRRHSKKKYRYSVLDKSINISKAFKAFMFHGRAVRNSERRMKLEMEKLINSI